MSEAKRTANHHPTVFFMLINHSFSCTHAEMLAKCLVECRHTLDIVKNALLCPTCSYKCSNTKCKSGKIRTAVFISREKKNLVSVTVKAERGVSLDKSPKRDTKTQQRDSK